MKRAIGPVSFVATFVATCGFLTFVPAALRRNSHTTGAGLIGTAVGWLTLRWLPTRPMSEGLMLVGFLFIGVVICDVAQTLMEEEDDPRIVLDEWIGFWVAAAFLPRTWPWLTTAFILFRIFDVWKPGWIRTSSRLPGGWGIMADDIVAGLFGNLLLQGARLILSR